ncbi:MAG: MATE family efflux transporter [Nitrospirota bacterium]
MFNTFKFLLKKDQPLDLTIGNLWTNIWQLSWPIFLIMVFNFFVGFADIYVAGFISPDVQAAVGFVGQIYFLIVIIANAISIGTLAMVSRVIGAKNTEQALEIAKQSLIFSLFVALGLTIVGFSFYREIILLAGFPEKIRGISEDFLRIFSLALGPVYVLNISNAIFRASGEVKKPLFTMFLVSVINIIGDFVLVFGIYPFPELGYIGIALSTAFSSITGMIINLILFTNRRWRSLYISPWRISLKTIKKIINLGWPAAFLQFAWNAGSIVLYNILSRLGDASIAALASITNGLRIEAIIYLPAFALNMAASVLIGQNLGAKNTERAERLGWKIASAGVVITSFIAFIIFIWAEGFASIVTKNQAVLEETTRYLRFNMLSEPFMALSAVLGGSLQGAGDTKGTMWIIIISMWFIRLPLAYVFALLMNYGATGVWIAMITSMSIQGVLMAQRFYKGHWKRIEV